MYSRGAVSPLWTLAYKVKGFKEDTHFIRRWYSARYFNRRSVIFRVLISLSTKRVSKDIVIGRWRMKCQFYVLIILIAIWTPQKTRSISKYEIRRINWSCWYDSFVTRWPTVDYLQSIVVSYLKSGSSPSSAGLLLRRRVTSLCQITMWDASPLWLLTRISTYR